MNYQKFDKITTFLSDWRFVFLTVHIAIAILSFLTIGDHIPKRIVSNEDNATLLANGTRHGLNVGTTEGTVPFELAKDPWLAFSVLSFILVGALFSAASVQLIQKWDNSPDLIQGRTHLIIPFVYVLVLWLGVAIWPEIEFCMDNGDCGSRVLFWNGPTVPLFFGYGVLQGLLTGLIVWIYNQELVPDDIEVNSELLELHLENWWKRVQSITRLLLALVVGLSLPFVLTRTGLGIWIIAWLVIGFASSVVVILYYTFRKTKHIENQLRENERYRF